MDALRTLIDFFRARKGRLQGFRWRDGADFEVILHPTEAAAREASLAAVTPRCAFPPEDEALLVAADQAGATPDEKRGDLAKYLCQKNGLPWLEDQPASWSEKPSE